MKKAWIIAGTAGSFLVLAFLGFLLVWGLAGVRAVHRDLAIATFAVHGMGSELQPEALERELARFEGYLQGSVTRHSRTENLWLARVQFRAADVEAAQVQIRRWIEGAPTHMEVRPVLATFYKYRLERPGRGDLVYGSQEALAPLP